MKDALQMFNDGSTATAGTGGGVVTASVASPVMDLKKSGANGFWVELAVTGITGTQGTLSAQVQYCNTTNGTFIDGPQFDTVTSTTKRQAKLCQTNFRYAKMNYTTGGTSPSYVVVAGIVSGPCREDTV